MRNETGRCVWHSIVFFPQALAGEVGMSSELDEVSRSLLNGQIPAIWKKLAPDTLKSLGNWMSHFKKRHQQYSDWVRLLVFSQRGPLLQCVACVWPSGTAD